MIQTPIWISAPKLLPHRYTETSLVRIPINLSKLEREATASSQSTTLQPDPIQKHESAGKRFLRRLSSSASGGNKKVEDEIKIIPMTNGDYAKYWQRNEDGTYMPTVVEPEGGRQEWVRQQLEKEWVQKELQHMQEKHERYRPSLSGGVTGGLS